MGIKCMVGIAITVLVAAGAAWSQQPPYPVPAPQSVPVPQVRPQGSPYADPPTSYGSPGLPPSGGYQHRGPAPQAGTNQTQWPSYPYPQYHNPYYQGVDPRTAINGTIDWLFSLPAVLMDKVSNVVDRGFFPRQPATSGGSTAAPARNSPSNRLEQTAPNPLPQPGALERDVGSSGAH